MTTTTKLKSAAAQDQGVDRLAAMLAVMSAQIEAAVRESNAPAATLVETAHAMGRRRKPLPKG